MSFITNFSSWAYQGHPAGMIGKGSWYALLWPASLFYGLGLKIHRLFGPSKQYKLSIPVISVGSITVGGAGKSPITAFVAQTLLSQGYKVAILSRGYNRATKDLVVVADGTNILEEDPAQSGDEPLMLARQLTGKAIVIANSDRYQAGLRAIELGAQVAILDDGAQHQKLWRDLDIIVLNPEKPLGNGHLLPAGPLRDRPDRISQANLVWFHQSATTNGHTKLADSALTTSLLPPGGAWVQSCCHLTAPDIAGQKIVAFCGLARPENFLNSLKELNPATIVPIIFNDHHNYGPDDFKEIINKARANDCRFVITTEKDLVKIATNSWPEDLPLLTAKLELELIENKEIFNNLLTGVIHG